MINIIKNKTEKAFTLVEMAIVVTIIGLLMGGIMTAMKMVKNAKIAATVMQINNYTAATKTFEKTYGGLPGDLLDSDKKIKGCKAVGGLSGCQYTGTLTTYTCGVQTYGWYFITSWVLGYSDFAGSPFSGNCSAVPICTLPPGPPPPNAPICIDNITNSILTVDENRGDGIIGDPIWDLYTFRGKSLASAADSNTTDAETVLFWYELKQAGLISGITDAGLRGGKSSFGKSLPAAEIGGGFWVGNSDGNATGGTGTDYYNYTGRPQSLNPYSILGTVLALVKSPKGGTVIDPLSGIYGLSSSQRKNILTPFMAANIDRKLDDGKPDTGTVQAFGYGQVCYGGIVAPFSYNEKTSDKSCGIYALIHQ